ncbi:MAG: hypothetical protein OEW67_06080 [Cyclobacteriaceae bacterium]|nr:hypothetical protein [Cyclobacteriaceae bacterium]
MKKKVFIGLFILSEISCLAQTDSISNFNIESRESKSEQIEKARKLLLYEVMDSNKSKIKELTEYLLKCEDENYIALYPDEKWLINYWQKEFQKVLKGVIEQDSKMIKDLQKKVHPEEDYLFYELKELLSKDRFEIKIKIANSNFESSDKDFLILNLDYLLVEHGDSGISQDSLNTSSNIYLNKYPKSSYEDYLREYIRYQFKLSKWGAGLELFSGYGVFTGSISEFYSNNVPFGLAYNISTRNFTLYLRSYFGFGKTLKDIPVNSYIWEKGSKIAVFHIEASIGYNFYDGEKFRLTPFTGIATMDIGSTEGDIDQQPELKDAGLSYTTTYNVGVNIDWKIMQDKNSTINDSYTFIRLRYAYNIPKFHKKYVNSHGLFHYITIGFGGFGRKMKRVK